MKLTQVSPKEKKLFKMESYGETHQARAKINEVKMAENLNKNKLGQS